MGAFLALATTAFTKFAEGAILGASVYWASRGTKNNR